MAANASTELWVEIGRLHADYADAVDRGDWERWIEMFTDDGVYRVVPRENFDRGFPLGTMALTGKRMLQDRVYGIRETLFHDPYYQRHVVGAPLVRPGQDEQVIAEANYAVFRTKLSELTTVYNVGRYLDTLVRIAGELKFLSRVCVYDSELIPNSLIYPV